MSTRLIVQACEWMAALFVVGLAEAATLTWDANTGTTGARDGDGTWVTGGNNWWTGSANIGWANGDAAIFGANNGIAGTVTISGMVTNGTANPLTFNAAGSEAYLINGGTICIRGAGIRTITANVDGRINSDIVRLNDEVGDATVVTGDGILTLGGAFTIPQELRITEGNLKVSPGANVTILAARIGYQGTGTLIYKGGDLTFADSSTTHHHVGSGAGGNGSFAIRTNYNVSGALDGNWSIGYGNDAVGRIYVEDGATAKFGRSLTINNGSSGTVVQTISAGTLQSPGTTIIGASGAGGSGTLTVDGTGVFTQSLGVAGTYVYIGSGSTGNGILNVASNASVYLRQRAHVLGQGHASSQGTVNLDGGTLYIRGNYPLTNGIGNGYFNFNGGTLHAIDAAGSILQGVTRALVKTGGAKVNSSGFSISIPQRLEHDSALGATPDGGLTKQGSGTLTLTNANTYSGPTRVEAGTLSISVPYLAEAADVQIDASAFLNLNFTGTNPVNALYFGDVAQADGVWGSNNTSRITGPGRLQIGIAGLVATTNNVIGTYTNWPTTWVPLNAVNDPDDGLANEQLDFVGDATNAGGYYAYNRDYVFFRQRVDVGTASGSTFHDSHFVLIDVVGQDYNTTTKTLQAGTDGLPDYGFTWDSKSTVVDDHGLEMVVRLQTNAQWSGVQMADIDGLSGQKGTNDINGSSRATDGYLRTIDQQNTTNFGTTTFIDYAVKWSYLQQYTGLTSNQSWRIAFASIANATDHNTFNGDISGGANTGSSITQGWASVLSTPTSSGIDLHAFQAADGIYVEFVAYDVANEGAITLALLDSNGDNVWTGTTNVTPSDRLVCRFLVPDLVVGGTYNFAVRDEEGKGWSAPGIKVGEFAAEMVSLSLTGITLSFASLPDREYEIQWTERLGGSWQTVTQIKAVNDRTSVFVSYPSIQAATGFFRILLK